MNETSCFNLNILSEVCKFVDRITMKLNTHRTEVYSFKEDIKISMIAATEELIASGYTAEDALMSTIRSYEADEFIKKEIVNLKQGNKKTQKVFFLISCVSLIITLLLLITAYFHNAITIKATFFSKSYPIIGNNLGSDDNLITENMKSSLRNFVNSKWFVESAALYKSDVSQTNEIGKNFTYTYSKNKIAIDNNYFSKENSSFLFSYRTHHDYTSVPNTAYTVDAVYRYRIFGYGFFIITFAIFLIYWLSFTLWASFNVSYSGNSKYWVVLILLTNILGYSIFEEFLNKQREGIPLIN